MAWHTLSWTRTHPAEAVALPLLPIEQAQAQARQILGNDDIHLTEATGYTPRVCFGAWNDGVVITSGEDISERHPTPPEGFDSVTATLVTGNDYVSFEYRDSSREGVGRKVEFSDQDEPNAEDIESFGWGDRLPFEEDLWGWEGEPASPGSESFATAAEDWLFGGHPRQLPSYALWFGTPPKPDREAARERAGRTFLRHLQRWLPVGFFVLFFVTMLIGGIAAGDVLVFAMIGVIGGAIFAGIIALIFRVAMAKEMKQR
ncbi:prepilin peptidase [Ruania alba]|uniref:Uncharacterized protein n=1 Tax=Ruania alba TaxID=648782 RepID=A0A1H5N7V4_9MICO|nr:prepilin peptidase [Ruania alba]SEE96748.1 hypothetical protein SAMN04488554_3955 [Ruania alba]